MPVVHFKGRVIPEFSEINVRGLPPIAFTEPPTDGLPNGLHIVTTITIENSEIDLECDVKEYEPRLMGWIHNRVIGLARAIVDLYGFTLGVSLLVVLDKFVDENRSEKKLLILNHSLQECCTLTSFEPGEKKYLHPNRALEMVLGDGGLFLGLRDLISAITYPNIAAINCARAVESLRILAFPDEEKKDGWKRLRSDLNLSLEYLLFITRTSEKPRHGDRSYIDGPTIEEVTRRAWIVFDRFLHYRARGNRPLKAPEFQLL